jgi:hypothetical protein
MGHAYLSNISEFFLRRLYAVGSMSIEDCTVSLQKAGETLHASEGEYEDVDMLKMGLTDLIIFLRCGHKFSRFTLENFTRAAVSGETKLKAYIIPAELTPRQKENLLQYDEGGDVWATWDEADWCEFEHIKWKYAPGWRMKYKKIPRLNHVEH